MTRQRHHLLFQVKKNESFQKTAPDETTEMFENQHLEFSIQMCEVHFHLVINITDKKQGGLMDTITFRLLEATPNGLPRLSFGAFGFILPPSCFFYTP